MKKLGEMVSLCLRCDKRGYCSGRMAGICPEGKEQKLKIVRPSLRDSIMFTLRANYPEARRTQHKKTVSRIMDILWQKNKMRYRVDF